jgi:hypothetical protein
VHGEDLVVGLGAQKVVAGNGELEPDQQRQDAGEQKEEERRGDVEMADDGVVDGADDAPAFGRFPRCFQSFELSLGAGQRIGVVRTGRGGMFGGRAHFRLAR